MQAELLEWIGSLTGIVGAVMMASNTKASPWAYMIWIIASVTMLVFALVKGHSGLALQQACFTLINTVGLYRWLLRPAVIGQRLHT